MDVNQLPATSARMVGLDLGNGWRVIRHFEPAADTSGGYFSAAYEVEHEDGHRGFLKALNFARVFRRDQDLTLQLQAMTTAYNFERDLLERCKRKRLDRVVVPVESGTAFVPGTFPGMAPYLIFNLAEGDIYVRQADDQSFETAWTLRCLHHIATGLWQLHKEGVAHQDLKPSNVLVYSHTDSKLTDLGRAAHPDFSPPHHDTKVAGDITYAPPELLYAEPSSDWNRRRFGCDAYLLGSMVIFFFLGAGATHLMQAYLDESHRFRRWAGSFEDLLPHLNAAFGEVLEEFRSAVPESIRDELTAMVQQLCEPDPIMRGHPRTRAQAARRGNPYSLERYVASFDSLARRAELRLLKDLHT